MSPHCQAELVVWEIRNLYFSYPVFVWDANLKKKKKTVKVMQMHLTYVMDTSQILEYFIGIRTKSKGLFIKIII